MAGDTRIIAFGAPNEAAADHEGGATPADAGPEPLAADWDEEQASVPAAGRGWIAASCCLALAAGWTTFFLWSVIDMPAAAVTRGAIVAAIGQWATPLVLLALVWLIVMRSSRREALRFGQAAALLSREAELLETRLTTVNGELSLARDFIAAQSRDLESLGRLAVERIGQNATRLQDLIQENGARLQNIDGVGRSALENMDKLRGQLPVIASSAKDVTNHIGNAGRVAEAQLETLVGGLDRLAGASAATQDQIAAVQAAVDQTSDAFSQICEAMDRGARARFEALAAQGADLRTQLELDEVAALAAIRSRAATLAEEIATTRTALDGQEAESLISLRSRLTSLRDEGGVVARALQETEARAANAWSARLVALDAERHAANVRIDEAQHAALEGLRLRIEQLVDRSEDLQARLSEYDHAAMAALEDRVERLSASASDMQERIARDEQDAITRIRAQLVALDGGIAQRLADHERHADALAQRAQSVAETLGAQAASMANVAASALELEGSMSRSLGALSGHLANSRTSLAATGGDIEQLTDASVRLLELIQASVERSSGPLPQALSHAEERLIRSRDLLTGVLGDLDEGQRRGDAVGAALAESRDTLGWLLADIAAAQEAVSARTSTHQAEVARLRSALLELEGIGARVEAKTRAEIGAALVELSDAVRAALVTLDQEGQAQIRSLAERLGDESAQAIDRAMRPRAAEAAGALEQAIAHAAGAGREAAAQLREQIGVVNGLVAQLEGRVEQARQKAQEEVDNDFGRRVALITDALNSNAIDIAGAMSRDVSDTAWSAYLRGDRGIFTRRAVSLLSAGEVRAVQQLFERDDRFREQVSRYIHDFEALLRQVLSTRDGNAFGVTLLSSDMGKLYVALAQGIERLRT